MSLMTFTVYTTGVYGSVTWYNFNTKELESETFSGGDQIGPYNCDPSYGVPTVYVTRILTGYTTPQVWTFSPGSTYTRYAASYTDTIDFTASERTLTISATEEQTQYTYYAKIGYSLANGGSWSDGTTSVKYGDTYSTTTEASSGDVYCTVWSTTPTPPSKYKFKGWATNTSGTGTIYTSGDYYTITSSSQSSSVPATSTLYAIYEAGGKKFYFGGVSDSNDATFIRQGAYTTSLTATMWNNFQQAIYDFGTFLGLSITKYTVSSNTQMLASTYNNTITQINKIRNKIGSSRSAPSSVTKDVTVVKASQMTGSGSIKAYYNGLVDDYYS